MPQKKFRLGNKVNQQKQKALQSWNNTEMLKSQTEPQQIDQSQIVEEQKSSGCWDFDELNQILQEETLDKDPNNKLAQSSKHRSSGSSEAILTESQLEIAANLSFTYRDKFCYEDPKSIEQLANRSKHQDRIDMKPQRKKANQMSHQSVQETDARSKGRDQTQLFLNLESDQQSANSMQSMLQQLLDLNSSINTAAKVPRQGTKSHSKSPERFEIPSKPPNKSSVACTVTPPSKSRKQTEPNVSQTVEFMHQQRQKVMSDHIEWLIWNRDQLMILQEQLYQLKDVTQKCDRGIVSMLNHKQKTMEGFNEIMMAMLTTNSHFAK